MDPSTRRSCKWILLETFPLALCPPVDTKTLSPPPRVPQIPVVVFEPGQDGQAQATTHAGAWTLVARRKTAATTVVALVGIARTWPQSRWPETLRKIWSRGVPVRRPPLPAEAFARLRARDLYEAVKSSNVHAACSLLDAGASPWLPLQEKSRTFTVFSLLLSRMGRSTLSRPNSADRVFNHILAGPPPLRWGNEQNTPLHAVMRSSPFPARAYQLLQEHALRHHLPRNPADASGKTVLHSLLKADDSANDFVLSLIRQGENLKVRTPVGETALSLAAQKGNMAAVIALLDAGQRATSAALVFAMLRARDLPGSRSEWVGVVKRLLDGGASSVRRVRLPSGQHTSALELAANEPFLRALVEQKRLSGVLSLRTPGTRRHRL